MKKDLKFKGAEPRWKYPTDVVLLQKQLYEAGYMVGSKQVVQAWEAMTDLKSGGWALLYEDPAKNVEAILSQLIEI